MKKKYLWFLLLILLASCKEKEPTVIGRWYTPTQVSLGKEIFQNNCAVCHGNQAQGTLDWKKPLFDGSYPPPPLNGTAHAWHHSLKILKRTIKEGTIPLGGKMPPFKNKLSDKEVESAIAFFQNNWNEKIYNTWIQNKGLK